MSEEVPINNQLTDVDSWKPYDFLTFVEQEMSLRGKTYQVMDLQQDLGALKSCITYAKSVGKGNYSVVEYIIWLLDGITDAQITSLMFFLGPLRHFYGDSKPGLSAIKKKHKPKAEVKLSPAMVAWLDTLKDTPEQGRLL